ncbi:MAG: cytochrome b5 domain-containing protein [Patescibacteria group bacterium]|jgi:predicted heme/steroid binding protein
MNKWIKIDRFFAWVLFCGMLLYFISGYGMTKGIIDSSFASKLHLNFLTYVILIAFTIHTSFAIHLAFKRWQIWNGPMRILLIAFFAAFFSAFVYVDRYYQPADNSVKTTDSTNLDNKEGAATDQTPTTEETEQIKTFTLDELTQYNGKNGAKAYVAVDGDVYDLTSVFQSGSHFSHYAGTELTNAFYTRHAKSALSKYPIVGKLAD